MAYYTVKVCMLGNNFVGKSCLLMRFAENRFDPGLSSTIGAGYRQKKVRSEMDTLYQLEVWDTPGHERYQATNAMYCRAARVGLVVFDVTNRETFDGAKQWIELFNENCNIEEFLLVLVGNKTDADEPRKVDENEAQTYASTIGAIYWETSAKTGDNVAEVFGDICTKLEERGNKNLKLVADPTAAKKRTLTVLTEAGELIEPRSHTLLSRCCT